MKAFIVSDRLLRNVRLLYTSSNLCTRVVIISRQFPGRTIGQDEVGAKGCSNGSRGLGLNAALRQRLPTLGRELLLASAERHEAAAHGAPVPYDQRWRLAPGILCAARQGCCV